MLQPNLESIGKRVRTFAFRMKEVNPSNWVAVGLCHKNLIVSKGYNFTFSQLGHGSYMISSNGGTWSNHQASSSSNNVVKAFKFAKGDTVACRFDPVQKKVDFFKEKPGGITYETYKLDLASIEGDPLCACVLFYYQNDEVELINNYKLVGV